MQTELPAAPPMPPPAATGGPERPVADGEAVAEVQRASDDPTAEVTGAPSPQADTDPEADSTGAPPTQPEHTEPSPEMARIAAVLRYYEPLLEQHGLSATDVVAYIDRPGIGYSYDPDNPVAEYTAKVSDKAMRLGGTFPRGRNAWVTYEVGEARGWAADQLTNLGINLVGLLGGSTRAAARGGPGDDSHRPARHRDRAAADAGAHSG